MRHYPAHTASFMFTNYCTKIHFSYWANAIIGSCETQREWKEKVDGGEGRFRRVVRVAVIPPFCRFVWRGVSSFEQTRPVLFPFFAISDSIEAEFINVQFR